MSPRPCRTSTLRSAHARTIAVTTTKSSPLPPHRGPGGLTFSECPRVGQMDRAALIAAGSRSIRRLTRRSRRRPPYASACVRAGTRRYRRSRAGRRSRRASSLELEELFDLQAHLVEDLAIRDAFVGEPAAERTRALPERTADALDRRSDGMTKQRGPDLQRDLSGGPFEPPSQRDGNELAAISSISAAFAVCIGRRRTSGAKSNRARSFPKLTLSPNHCR